MGETSGNFGMSSIRILFVSSSLELGEALSVFSVTMRFLPSNLTEGLRTRGVGGQDRLIGL